MQNVSSLFSIRRCRAIMLATAFAGILSFATALAQADVLSIANPVAITGTVNLSSTGNDWAHYATANPPINGNVPMTFDHPAGTNFSAISQVGFAIIGLAAYDTTDPLAPLMTWTDGTPDATGSSRSFVYSPDSYYSNNIGVSLTYTLAPGPKLINLYTSAYTGGVSTPLPVEVTASLSSGLSTSNTANLPIFYDTAEEDGDYAILAVNSSQSNETLTLSFIQTGDQYGGNADLLGVTAAAVPEPASLSLIALGASALLGRRRSQR